MKIKPLRDDLYKILEKHNTRYPSLHTEKLEPKHLNIHSFRINRKWRAIFIVTKKNEVEVVDINPHYK